MNKKIKVTLEDSTKTKRFVVYQDEYMNTMVELQAPNTNGVWMYKSELRLESQAEIKAVLEAALLVSDLEVTDAA